MPLIVPKPGAEPVIGEKLSPNTELYVVCGWGKCHKRLDRVLKKNPDVPRRGTACVRVMMGGMPCVWFGVSCGEATGWGCQELGVEGRAGPFPYPSWPPRPAGFVGDRAGAACSQRHIFTAMACALTAFCLLGVSGAALAATSTETILHGCHIHGPGRG